MPIEDIEAHRGIWLSNGHSGVGLHFSGRRSTRPFRGSVHVVQIFITGPPVTNVLRKRLTHDVNVSQLGKLLWIEDLGD